MSGKLVKTVLAIAFSLAILFILAGAYAYRELSVPVSEDAIFTIHPGSNLSVITRRLINDDLLPVDDTVFKAFALLTRQAGSVQAGQYQLNAGMRTPDVLALIRSGKVIQHRITFPEGLRLDQWLVKLHEAPYLRPTTLGMSMDEMGQALGLETDPEGWLFPDTYQYTLGHSDLDILKLAVVKMKAVLDSEWNGRAITSLSSPYEALILASIVEKETGYAPDREKIASVFHNRLGRGMRLQSDPTVIFGLGKSFDGDLTRSHLRSDTPYNTYTRAGLPPGPICSSGRASIRAALAGSSHPYLYFVSMGDGKSYFSVNLEEHNMAVNEYQKKRKP